MNKNKRIERVTDGVTDGAKRLHIKRNKGILPTQLLGNSDKPSKHPPRWLLTATLAGLLSTVVIIIAAIYIGAL